MSTIKVCTSAALAAIIGFGFTYGVAAAGEVEDFYKGKRITMLVGSGPGGGYDTYARLIARHMGRHIPGNPSFITQNKNGAASVIAVERRSESRIGVSPTSVFFSDTVLETTNWAYSHAALRRSSGVLFRKVQAPASW